MGHHIDAIIGKGPINEEKAKAYGLAIAYELGYAIVVLDWDSVLYWSGKLNLSCDSTIEDLEWDCELIHYFARELNLNDYALIKTDYFAGIGDQYAALYKNGILAWHGRSINIALAEIGIMRTLNLDEFDTINLGEYRNSEHYYFDSQHNFALKKDNMIAGKVFKD
ncbi:hypothetical protein SNE26_26740 [Mucilaginibacter sp. cycad4]|uniref:hypothetical protein n=1 Tax=Mucilaginibacter sp. cycad4 TaxID=3342096 RepID=UPI002AAB2F5F|nr:hypothetical protein [Mucilaginibacter gossypii]WPU99618.1 hypothetical protein SNE26_26740 [Mucilaginibacter gossypii]